MNKLNYRINCIEANGSAISAMIDEALEITWGTFISHVNKDDVINLFPNYYWRGFNSIKDVMNLTLWDDYAVNFYRSKYKGRKCYYIEHSSIEYIFY